MAKKSNPHSIGVRGYVLTYAALLALATLSWVLVELPVHTGLWVALLVAAIKAGLVLWVFMHLAEESAAFRVAIVGAAFLVITLIALSAVDPMTRAPQPLGHTAGKWPMPHTPH